MLRARFQVTSLTLAGEYIQVRMQAVGNGTPEDKPFWEATPSGELTMCIKKEAAEEFKLGENYFLDFSQGKFVKFAGEPVGPIEPIQKHQFDTPPRRTWGPV